MATEIEVVHRDKKGNKQVDEGPDYIHPYRYFMGDREKQPKPQVKPVIDSCSVANQVCADNTLYADW